MPCDRLDHNQSSVIYLGAIRKRRSDGLRVNDTIAHTLLLLESRTCVVLLRVSEEETVLRQLCPVIITRSSHGDVLVPPNRRAYSPKMP
jgi:hypothetical protein